MIYKKRGIIETIGKNRSFRSHFLMQNITNLAKFIDLFEF